MQTRGASEVKHQWQTVRQKLFARDGRFETTVPHRRSLGRRASSSPATFFVDCRMHSLTGTWKHPVLFLHLLHQMQGGQDNFKNKFLGVLFPQHKAATNAATWFFKLDSLVLSDPRKATAGFVFSEFRTASSLHTSSAGNRHW